METVQVAHDAGVTTITLDRPHRKNAIDAAMWEELRSTLRGLAVDGDVRCVVITGADDAFCSGADLSGRAEAGERPHQLAFMRGVGDVALALHHLPQPTIAKVNGVAAGAGCNLALGCDLVVASDRARFSQIFVRRGLSVDFGGTWLLPRLVGLHKAKELALLGDVVDAVEADRIGIVNRVVPHDELDGFVGEWAARLAAGPPIALAMTKRMLNQSLTHGLEEALDAEGLSQTVNSATVDTAEAIAAFVEKRDPTFHGR
jgi:2-(1,2-epoxy-1,2-dihydrophenyl)acetyl-CoA isomerase